MKFTAIIVLSACLTTSAEGYSQKVTLFVKNAPLEKVFKEIKKQTGYVFFYDASIVEAVKPVTIDVKNVTVEAALAASLRNLPLDYSIENKTITIVKKENLTVVLQPVVNPPPPIYVRGRITNENGEPVAGATITVKGTNNGITSNADGYFELKGVDENATLIISGVSIETREIKVGGKTDLAIIIKIAIKDLDAVVINKGYYTSSQKMNTGSVSKVTASVIEKQPVSNPLQALQGRMAGVTITQQTGVPGGNFVVQIRGQNSLRNNNVTNGNNPLYIIDGSPFIVSNLDILVVAGGGQLYPNSSASGASPLNSINPADIVSIEVLKDADATAIYGSRGANGVILITTKKGKAGKMQVDVNFYTGVGKVTRKMELLNTAQYIEMRKEAFKNDGITTYPANAYDVNGTWDQTRYTDWQKELIGGTAKYTDAQISFSGGTANSQYRLGGGYHKETTVFHGDFSDQRGSVHISLSNSSPNQKFKNQVSINYSVNTTNLLVRDLTAAALTLAPNAPGLYNGSGNLNFENLTFSENPLQYTKRPYDANTYNLMSNVSMGYMVLPGLNLKANLGYTSITRKEINKAPISSTPNTPGIYQNSTRFGNSVVNSWVIEPQITYQKKIRRGSINLLTGSTFQNENIEQVAQFARGFLSEALMDNISAVPAANVSSTYSGSVYRYTGIFGRINYELRNKYIFNLTGRRDGSSRFGPGKQFGNFGSVAFAWIFSEESVVKKHLPFLSYGKLRTSYGTTGSDQIANYGFLDTYTTTGAGQYQGVPAVAPVRLLNPDFRWESNKKLEAALELGFLQDRILLTANYYRNRSSNQLIGYPLPATTGFTSIQYNFEALVQNTGFELELNTNPVQTKNFKWNSSLNLTIARNKLVSFPNLAAYPAYALQYVVGKPLAISKVFIYTGVDQMTGLHMVQDVDGNNTYNLSDRQSISSLMPKFYGGWQNNLQWKGWQIDFLFQFTKQDGLSSFSGFGPPGIKSNQPVEVMRRWQKPGDETNIQRFTSASSISYSNILSSDAFITDASFIRLKNFSLAYQLADGIIQKLKLKTARIFIQGQNLITITNYKGLDPESDGFRLPPLRVITTGIQITL